LPNAGAKIVQSARLQKPKAHRKIVGTGPDAVKYIPAAFESAFLGSDFGASFFDSGFDSDFFSGAGASFFDSSFLGAGSEDAGSLDSDSLESDSVLFFPPSGGPPSSRRSKSCPTVTVSSSLTRNSLIVPASGALTAISIC